MVNRSYLTFSLGNVDHEPSGELPEHYQVLGLKRSASQEDIKEAFRNKARETHPDKIGGDGEQFKIVRESYETLIS